MRGTKSPVRNWSKIVKMVRNTALQYALINTEGEMLRRLATALPEFFLVWPTPQPFLPLRHLVALLKMVATPQIVLEIMNDLGFKNFHVVMFSGVRDEMMTDGPSTNDMIERTNMFRRSRKMVGHTCIIEGREYLVLVNECDTTKKMPLYEERHSFIALSKEEADRVSQKEKCLEVSAGMVSTEQPSGVILNLPSLTAGQNA